MAKHAKLAIEVVICYLLSFIHSISIDNYVHYIFQNYIW
ncbi:hypothetical protein M23134_08265 [Microscilla marina ATCC 23134]|uniref:Uncharacterized protein n=1 Tax=Microscilla marina ATCC 23134 TaxID=313606 RepID=A1ZQE1_MICM2|nr:hypothetical protein M23134_08265 [Microscilla marina ATCC 23134]